MNGSSQTSLLPPVSYFSDRTPTTAEIEFSASRLGKIIKLLADVNYPVKLVFKVVFDPVSLVNCVAANPETLISTMYLCRSSSRSSGKPTSQSMTTTSP